MNDSDCPGRRLKVTLVVRDEKDDPSILDIVRVAVEDGLRTPAIGSAAAEQPEPSKPPEHHPPVDEKLETAAREAVEEALAKVIEQFQATGQEPSFDPAKWAEQLSKVWAVVRKAKAAGVDIRVTPGDPPPAAEGS
jgi:hypothetical protein